MKRSPFLLFLMLAACAQVPREGANRATVESRAIPAKPGAQARATPGRADNRAAPQKTRVAGAESDAESAGGEPQQIIDRQSRRIAELESRGTADPEARQVLELVSYAQRIAGLRPEEQAREFTVANQEYARDPQPYSRLRLALLLSTPGTSSTDETRAASLLEPLVSAPAKGPVRQFASLVHAQISERLREQKRVAQLKEQIDGLRAIDRSLIDRDQGRTP